MQVSGAKIELDSLVVGMVNVSKTAVVGCMNRSVHCFHIKGKKLWSMYMPGACRVRLLLHPPATRLRCTPCTCADDIVCMEKMEVAMVSIVRAVVIALKGGEVRVYNEKQLVIKIPPRNKASPDPVMGTWPSPLRLPPHLLVHVRMAR